MKMKAERRTCQPKDVKGPWTPARSGGQGRGVSLHHTHSLGRTGPEGSLTLGLSCKDCPLLGLGSHGS